MTRVITLLLLLACVGQVQAQQYTLTVEQNEYTPLTDYTSLMFEYQDLCFWTLDYPAFEFGFDFPFYNETYSKIYMDHEGYATFNPDDEYSVLLFGGDWENLGCEISDTISDWRYQYTTEKGLQVLKLEWYNVGISDDIESENPTDHYINYQTWFYEDGTIELRLGDIDLENSPFYEEGTGLIWDDGEVYGPWIGINTPTKSEGLYIGAPYEEPLIGDVAEIPMLFDIPPSGWTVKFQRTDATTAIEEMAGLASFKVYPTISSDVLNWKFEADKASNIQLTIFNNLGQVVKFEESLHSSGEIDVNTLPNGIYYLRSQNEDFIQTDKFVVKK